MAFEHFAYLRITVAAEATLKIIGVSLLSEAVYRFGSEAAKKIIADTVDGHALSWRVLFETAAKLPGESALASRVRAAPAGADALHDRWTRIDALLTSELGVAAAASRSARR